MNSGSTLSKRGTWCGFLTFNHLKAPNCHVHTPKHNNPVLSPRNTDGTSHMMCHFHLKDLFRRNVLYSVFKIYFLFFFLPLCNTGFLSCNKIVNEWCMQCSKKRIYCYSKMHWFICGCVQPFLIWPDEKAQDDNLWNIMWSIFRCLQCQYLNPS